MSQDRRLMGVARQALQPRYARREQCRAVEVSTKPAHLLRALRRSGEEHPYPTPPIGSFLAPTPKRVIRTALSL